MGFNYRLEFAKFKSEWEKQEIIIRNEGMSDEDISELYNFSYEQFKGDRNYSMKIDDFTSADSEEEIPSGKKARRGIVKQPVEFDECLDLLEQIENMKLLKALNELPKEHYELFCLHVIQGFSQVEIAQMTKQSKQNVCNKINRIKKFLKKFF